MQRMYSEERRVKSSLSAASRMVQKSHTYVGMGEYNKMLQTAKSGRSIQEYLRRFLELELKDGYILVQEIFEILAYKVFKKFVQNVYYEKARHGFQKSFGSKVNISFNSIFKQTF